MEKLLLSRLSLFFLLFIPIVLNAQEYAVFDVEGSPMLIGSSMDRPIAKGTILRNGKAVLEDGDQLIVLNNNGDVFHLKTSGKYPVSDFKKHKKTDEEGFSSKYFAYVWREINQGENSKTNTGNIYRDGLINILVAPVDSLSTYRNKVVFTWNPDDGNTPYYFFLKNKATNTVSKMMVEGDSLTLFAGGNLLEKGNVYYWGVSKDEYPDFTRIKMNQLNYLDNAQYKLKKMEMAKLIDDLKKIGLSETEIKEQLCLYFKICG